MRPGECYHLYPRCVYDTFAEYQLPEILRTPLQSLGRHLTMLPMEPKLGKMLILGAVLNCLDPVLTIVAGLSVRDPFLTPLDKKDASKSQFSHDYSDHLALVRAYEGRKEAEIDLAGYGYCWKIFLSAQSMKAIDSLREEFLSLLKDTGLLMTIQLALIVGAMISISSDQLFVMGCILEFALLWIVLYFELKRLNCELSPLICILTHNEKSCSLKTMEDGLVLLYSNSVNARESRIPYPWLAFNDNIKVNSVFLRDSTAISDSVLLLFGGSISRGDDDGHLKMLGGCLEFFMQPSLAERYLSLRREFDELIQNKLLNPQMALHIHHELISAIRLLVSEDQCNGRFVFGRQDLKPSNMPVIPPQKSLISRTECGPGSDNSKSQLQTLVSRAGYATPTYRTHQLKHSLFQATVEFNGMQITGRLCNNKKSAEKDAAAVALQWLMSDTWMGHDYINYMSMLLKKSKRGHSSTTVQCLIEDFVRNNDPNKCVQTLFYSFCMVMLALFCGKQNNCIAAWKAKTTAILNFPVWLWSC
ncbi:poly(A) polymerase-like [Hibiscus syriacus]|uniref:RNA helicase n=1 Tax=Hibiscus syriacus TaxID=106335 RepID=A0A6A2Y5Z0_HIBSY|nr:poly(A) polymerase-like [Hibiscus syriacus]